MEGSLTTNINILSSPTPVVRAMLPIPKNIYSPVQYFLHSWNKNLLSYTYWNFCANLIVFLGDIEENKSGRFTETFCTSHVLVEVHPPSDLQTLFSVFCAVIISRILYALPAWGGFLLLIWFAKLMIICVQPSDWVIMAILNCCLNLFMMRTWNCLEVCCIEPAVFIHELLPPLKFMVMKLRLSHCAYALPYCHNNIYKHSFILLCIFDRAY